MTADNTVLRVGRLALDRADQRVWLDGRALDLGPKPFALLEALMLSPQRLVTKEDLIERVWDGRFVSEAVLTTAMRDLRRALGDDARQPTFIATAHGRGYRFMLAVNDDAVVAAPTTSAQPLSAKAGSLPRLAGAAFAAIVACLASAWLLTQSAPSRAAATSTPASIAVLPFEDLSAGRDRAYFADGLAEEILNVLMGVDGLAVVRRWAKQLTGRLRPNYIGR